jgi:EAL and modified HD-GYP domain-containing signal transduction protein
VTSVFVARQPIFDANQRLFAYELLYRGDSTSQSADLPDVMLMSAGTIVSGVLGIGFKELAGDHVAFVNFARDQLVGESWQLFDPKQVVIELLETVDCDDEVEAACRRLVAAGYRLALDDYVHDGRMDRLLDIASIIKVDVLGSSPQMLATLAGELRPRGLRLLAERVETSTVRDTCLDLGFDLFQGYFFARPETMTKSDVNVGQLATLRLLNLLKDPNTSDAELERAFQTDVALCYKLLRMVNAAAIGGRGITSIPHAIRVVGRDTLMRWVALIFVSSMGRQSDVTREMALAAITRARMCELVTRAAQRSAQESSSAFVAGLLSLIDSLLQVPMTTVLDKLDLASDIREALIERTGPMGAPLRLVESYEAGGWEYVRRYAMRVPVSEDEIPAMYVDALAWAQERMAAA